MICIMVSFITIITLYSSPWVQPREVAMMPYCSRLFIGNLTSFYFWELWWHLNSKIQLFWISINLALLFIGAINAGWNIFFRCQWVWIRLPHESNNNYLDNLSEIWISRKCCDHMNKLLLFGATLLINVQVFNLRSCFLVFPGSKMLSQFWIIFRCWLVVFNFLIKFLDQSGLCPRR